MVQIGRSHILTFVPFGLVYLLGPTSFPISPQRLSDEYHSSFKWDTDCFSCLFKTHGSAASHNPLFLPRTICVISWIKMILIISQWGDPWQLWIPLESDQRPLASHLYGQSNSSGPAWVTRGAWLYTLLSLVISHIVLHSECSTSMF